MPKVSICIPCYKQTKYLAKCLDSVLMQDLTDYEIIITDDTPDNTIKDFLDKNYKNEKIQYYKNATSLGTPENWNEAIRKAKGEYVKLLHHDDFFTQKNSLTKFVALLDANTKADFAFCATEVWNVPSDKKWIHQCSDSQLDRMKKEPETLFFGNKIGAPSATICRSSLNETYDKKLKWLVDIEYYIRVIKKNHLVIMSTEALICTADNTEGQVSQNVIEDKNLQIKEHLAVFSTIGESLIAKPTTVLFFDELFCKFGINSPEELNSIYTIPKEQIDFFKTVINQLHKNTLYKKWRNWFYGSRFNNHFFKLEKY